jgi:hypothetical protein
MADDMQSKSPCDPLNGKVAEPLQFKFLHSLETLMIMHYLSPKCRDATCRVTGEEDWRGKATLQEILPCLLQKRGTPRPYIFRYSQLSTLLRYSSVLV